MPRFKFNAKTRFGLMVCALAITALRVAQAQAPATVTVSDTVYTSAGALFTGNMTISWPSFTSPDNKEVIGSSRLVSVTAGVLSVALVPNVGSKPAGTSYRVTFAGDLQFWVIPASGPVTIAAIRTTRAPTPSILISPNQVSGTAIVANPTGTQTITAAGTAGATLRFKGKVAANANILEIYDSASTPALQARFDSGGALILVKPPTFSSISAGQLLSTGTAGLVIGIPTATYDDTTKALTLRSGAPAASDGASLIVRAGNSADASHGGGSTFIGAGDAGASGVGGNVYFSPGSGVTSGTLRFLNSAGGGVGNFTTAGDLLLNNNLSVTGAATAAGFSGPLTGNVTGNVSGSAATITGAIVEANTPLTTKGDLLVEDGATLHRLAVGTNAQVLTADSASTDGVKWAAPATSGTVTSIATTSPITGGTITATGTIACATCVTSAAALAVNQLVLGGALQATATLGSLGTTTTVLHGNAGGAPSFAAVTSADTTGTFPATAHNLFSATHGDTVTASPVRGDIIIANSTPAWTKLALGAATAGKYAKSNGTDVVISTGSASGIGTPTACTNQFVTGMTLNADAVPTSTCTTLTAASAQLANQGTTTTLLHGNAAGNPSWAGVSLANDTAANQGTTTTVLHGNAAGQPSFGAVAAGDLASTTGSGTTVVLSTTPTFTTSIKTPAITVPSDSTTALRVFKADGSTVVTTVDTTNARLGIGATPLAMLHVSIADTNPAVLFSGTTRGLRVGHNSVSSIIEGVDQTGTGSYQPLYFGGSVTGFTISGALSMYLDASGRLGIGTATQTNTLSLGGDVARTVGIERHSVANTAGVAGTWTMSGGSTVAATDKAAGAVVVSPGLGTGSAVPALFKIQGDALGTAAGTTSHTLVDRFTASATKVLTDATGIPLVSATIASNTVVAGLVSYAVEVFNGTDLQVEEGEVSYHVTNKAGALANNTTVKFGNQQAMTAGTLTCTWTITAASPAVLTLNCDTSLTPSAGYPRVTYSVENLTQQAIAIQ